MKKVSKTVVENVHIIIFIIIPIVIMSIFFITSHKFGDDDIFLGYDGISFFSAKLFNFQSILEGDFAVWNKYSAAGVPFEAFGTFYPLDFILGFLPIKIYICTYYGIHLFIAAYFMRKYLLEIKCTPYIATIVATLYECSIHFGGARKDHMVIISCVSLFPMILFFSQKYINSKQFKYLLLTALGMSLQFFTGFFQMALYSDIVVFFYLLCQMNKDWTLKRKVCDIVGWIMTYIGLIMVYLMPICMLMLEYKKGGSSNNSYENFKAFSISLYKIIMMIFPYIFGTDVWTSFGPYMSSGMDIELYIGSCVTLIVIFTIFKYWKQKMVRIASIFMIVAYVYAANAHIPFLGWIIYHIPLLNSFRCSARSLFIFIFFAYTLLGLGFTNINARNGKVKLEKYYSVSVVVMLIFAGAWGVVAHFAYFSTDWEALGTYMLKAFGKVIIVNVVVLACGYAIKTIKNIACEQKIKLMCVLLMLGALIEVMPFTLYANVSDINQLKAEDPLVEKMQANINEDKIWDDFSNLDSQHANIITQNTNITKRLQTINTYMAFNNPDVYGLMYSKGETAPLNCSGLFIGNGNAEYELKVRNDILSMFGVKYIIDSSDILKDGLVVVDRQERGENILLENNLNFPIEKNLYVYSYSINIDPNTVYRITVKAEGIDKQDIHLDLYGGAEYDSQSQQVDFHLIDTQEEYVGYIDSGNMDKISKEVVFRVFSTPSQEFTLKSVEVEKLGQGRTDVYELWDDSEEHNIYINKNVNPVLYVPDQVVNIESRSQFYQNMAMYNLDKTACVEAGINYEINNNKISISNTEFTNNQISAVIDAEEKGFVMFSQCYYPGWKAYINGEEVQLYKVNESIMGIELPKGKYNIQFKYTPIYLIYGGCFTIAAMIWMVAYLIIDYKNNTKK